MSWWLRILSGTVHWENIVKGQMVKTSIHLSATNKRFLKKGERYNHHHPTQKAATKTNSKMPMSHSCLMFRFRWRFFNDTKKKNSFTKLPHHFLTTLPPTLGSYKFEALRDTIFRASGSTCTDPWVASSVEIDGKFRFQVIQAVTLFYLQTLGWSPVQPLKGSREFTISPSQKGRSFAELPGLYT